MDDTTVFERSSRARGAGPSGGRADPPCGGALRRQRLLGAEVGRTLPGHGERGTGARLWFLPPYSPDLDPIEQAFAKIEHWMRSAQRRDFEDTWRHLVHLIGTIEPSECQNYIRNVGYGSV